MVMVVMMMMSIIEIGEIYKNICLDWKQENVDLRGYSSAIEVRNKSNDLPNEAVDALLTVCHDNHHLFHRFFKLKKKILGYDNMYRWDIYAPIELKSEENISYEDSVKMVMVPT